MYSYSTEYTSPLIMQSMTLIIHYRHRRLHLIILGCDVRQIVLHFSAENEYIPFVGSVITNDFVHCSGQLLAAQMASHKPWALASNITIDTAHQNMKFISIVDLL